MSCQGSLALKDQLRFCGHNTLPGLSPWQQCCFRCVHGQHCKTKRSSSACVCTQNVLVKIKHIYELLLVSVKDFALGITMAGPQHVPATCSRNMH